MAIASNEPETVGPPGIILVAIRAVTEELVNIEKAMRQKGLLTLQKKKLEESLDGIQQWFPEKLTGNDKLMITGYVIQSRDVENVWKDFSQEFGANVCGLAPHDELRRIFPSVVLEDYLLQPALALEYLEQLRPKLMAGLQDVCINKPEDPVSHLALYLTR